MSDDSARPAREGPRTQVPRDDATLAYAPQLADATQSGEISVVQFPDEATTAPPPVEPTQARTSLTTAEAGTMVFAPGSSQSSGTVRPGHVMLTPLTAPAGETTRYTVTKLFAEGGLGKVWLASDKDLNREVVLKELRPAQARDPQILRRFVKEAQVTGQLEHPNIVPIYEMGKRPKDGRPFYTMRFVRGQTLRDLIGAYHDHKQQGQLDPLELPRLLTMFVSVCNAIAYAHSRGVIHRDLKPANVAVGEFGEVIVLDWGLAKILDQVEEDAPQIAISAEAETEATLMGDVMGTPGYMAPEQAAGDTRLSDARTDIYGLGAILFAILIGKPPHHGESTREVLEHIARGEVAAPRTVDPTVPAALNAVCQKAMRARPEDRYATVRDLAQDVERYLADEPVSSHVEPWWDRGRRWVRKHRTLCVTSAVAATALVMAYGAWAWWDARRLDRLRLEARQHARLGQLALAQGSLGEAKQKFSQALAIYGDEPELEALKSEAHQLLVEAQDRLAEQSAQDTARRHLAEFEELHDKALYHGTLLTGIDKDSNIAAAQEAARAALALLPADRAASGWRLQDERHFTPPEREQIRKKMYELWLVLADAQAEPVAGQEADRQRARTALHTLDSAEALGLKTRAIHLRRAQYLEQVGDTEAASQERQRAGEIEPDSAIDHFLVGDSLNKTGEIVEATRHFEQALRHEPDHFWSHYFLAVCHLKMDRPREAVAHLTAALTLQPDFGWTYLLRGYAYGQLGDYASADSDFELAQHHGVDDYGLYVNRAVVAIASGKLDEATKDLQLAIALRPEQYQAHVNLAVIHRRQGDFDEALTQLDRASRLAPQADTPYRTRAKVYLERGDLDKALADYDRALRYTARDSALAASDHLERGRILHRLKRYDEALAAYNAAAEINPDAPNLEYLRADALLAMRRGDEALTALDRYLETKVDEPDAYRLRGFQRAARGDSAGALADYTRALELEPNSALARGRRGWAYLNTASQLAEADFDQALKLDPNNSDLYNGRGFARVALGKYREGAADAEHALKLGVSGTEVREKMALYSNAACTLAQASGRAQQDLAATDHVELAAQYEHRALELLQQARSMLQAGLQKAWLKSTLADPAFDPIRHAEAFKRLANDAVE